MADSNTLETKDIKNIIDNYDNCKYYNDDHLKIRGKMSVIG